MQIHFLGTNNWYDTKTGQTPCTLIDTDEAYIILDAGYGIHKVDKYIKPGKPIYLFISHLHVDHICGLHVLPKLKFTEPLTIFCATESKKYLAKFTQHPFMSPIKNLPYKTKIVGIEPGKFIKPVSFVCKHLKHIDYDLGYRFNLEGKIITYCVDTAVCENDYLLAKGADLLIHECAFSPGSAHDFWGHSNPEDGAKLAKRAGVKKLMLSLFGASGYPSIMHRHEAERVARKIFKPTEIAFDDLMIEM